MKRVRKIIFYPEMKYRERTPSQRNYYKRKLYIFRTATKSRSQWYKIFFLGSLCNISRKKSHDHYAKVTWLAQQKSKNIIGWLKKKTFMTLFIYNLMIFNVKSASYESVCLRKLLCGYTKHRRNKIFYLYYANNSKRQPIKTKGHHKLCG